jgi:cytochrome b561
MPQRIIKKIREANTPPDTTEEKLNLILKYTKSTNRWMRIKGIISFIFLFVFLILPLIGGWFLFDYFKKNVDFTNKINNAKSQLIEFQNLGDEIKGMLRQSGE